METKRNIIFTSLDTIPIFFQLSSKNQSEKKYGIIS